MRYILVLCLVSGLAGCGANRSEWAGIAGGVRTTIVEKPK
jgi:hypothetical protein